MTTASSPASTGPAGPLFEAQVGAHYLLSLLIGLEPRGLPGARIERVKFQRAAEGHPLDDIVIHACDVDGRSAVLEIQVKRSLRFTLANREFRKVVAQIARASQKPEFLETRHHELGIAVERAHLGIQGSYREVLEWARQLGSAEAFMARIKRPHSANKDMRNFIGAFRAHLEHSGVPHDDEMVWQLLSRLHILQFDFTAQDSAYETWSREQATRALHPDDERKAGALWQCLVALATRIAASGGDRDRARLIRDVRAAGFRLAGDRRYEPTRRALAENARHALVDISDRVGTVRLMRARHMAAIRLALDKGRYVEIRGDPGVGKSGLLKRLAEEISRQSHIIVLSPDRVTPGGWTAMRTALGFDGTARELLVDMAAGGGATLFIDGLGSFRDDEPLTVSDLVQEAADIPGFSVVVTARTGYGGEDEEAEWLPTGALDRLGRAPPVIVGELDADEVSELRDAAPELVPLLADAHPAKDIARNLFRLERLARQADAERRFRTEIDMAEDWWRTADGKEEGRRDRARLLRTLARQATASETLNAEVHPAIAIDALVKKGTLRDLVGDKVAFRHDVLRDWAVANLLFEEPGITGSLLLDRPASARLVRGLELAARMQLERGTDDGDWHSLLGRVSRDGAHGSWRRAVLLAVVRSEMGIDLLDRTADLLLADDAHLLIELIRTVKAVESRPLLEHLVRIVAPIPEAPVDLYVPSDPSWNRLVLWLLALGDKLPEAATADVAAFFTASYTGVLSQDKVGPLVAHWFYSRLEGIETHRSDPLASELRLGFLAVSHCAPSLTARYLRSLMKCHWHDEAVQTVMRLSSVVAQGAPQELANLTLAILIPSEADGSRPSSSHLPPSVPVDLEREPFGSNDFAFVPASPDQGPFLALLEQAPEIGLKLIHQLVDHAISFGSRGPVRDKDSFIIHFADSERIFSRRETYRWSRETGNGASCIQAALMALEAWAHRRVENHEEVEAVLTDVLPPGGGPAAYLLVVVDILLSHWPKSGNAAVPFLACPELLCLDLERMVADGLLQEIHDTSGSSSLKERPSKQFCLFSLLKNNAISGLPELRIEIAGLLQQSIERLGPYSDHAGRLDPAFMGVHALNLVNPANWRTDTSNLGSDSKPIYIPPLEEAEHLARLSASTPPSLADQDMQFAVRTAVLHPNRSSPEFVSEAVDWARRPVPTTDHDARDNADLRNLAIIATAVIVVRDGSEEVRTRHLEWARGLFVEALTAETGGRVVPGTNFQFNPIAMAFMGMVLIFRSGVEPTDVGAVLEAACRADLLAAPGFHAAAVMVADIDERLPRALLRTAFASCIRSRREYFADHRAVDVVTRLRSVVDRELGWLFGEDDEPEWPKFPIAPPVYLLDVHVPGRQGAFTAEFQNGVHSDSQEELYDTSAARWLTSASSLFDVKAHPWLRGLAEAYSEWTAMVNGSGLDRHDEVRQMPSEWNAAYYRLVAHCVPGLAVESIDRLALNPIRALPDEAFFDASSRFLRSLDRVYFEHGNLTEPEAVRIRAVLAERLVESQGWKWRDRDPSASIEVHMGSAVAAFFFNNWDRIPPSSCYMLAPGIPRTDPFLPVLERLIAKGPNGFVAGLALDLVEVSPRPEHLPFMFAASDAWLTAHGRESGMAMAGPVG